MFVAKYSVILAILMGIIAPMSLAETGLCFFKRYASAEMRGIIRNPFKDEAIIFKTLNSAQAACTRLETKCQGILDVTLTNFHEYYLASEKGLYMSPGSAVWIKECDRRCSYHMMENESSNKIYYQRICNNEGSADVEHNAMIEATWSSWSNWGSCSLTCGIGGTQDRFRICDIGSSDRDCYGENVEIRQCIFEKSCVKSVQTVYGISGQDKLSVSGSTSVYASCINDPPKERKQCGELNVDEETCKRFSCCYQSNVGPNEPRCFEPKMYAGSNGLLGWGVWGRWSLCSASCGKGVRYRQRLCTGANPGTVLCPGQDVQSEACVDSLCPCEDSPCNNGGVCQADDSLSSGYKCICGSMQVGKNCDYEKPELLCGETSISITFSKGILRDENLVLNPALIHFQMPNSQTCYARDIGENYSLQLPAPLGKTCGSTIETSENQYTVHNKVLWKLTHGMATSTVVIVDFKCVYNKKLNSTFSLDFGIDPTVRTLSVQEAYGIFQVDMKLFRDESYLPSQQFTTSPTIAEGEIVFVLVELNPVKFSNSENEVIVMEQCFVTSADDPFNPIHYLINHGCSTNEVFTTIISNGQSKEGKWAIRIFDWSTSSMTDDVYLHCRVRVCDVQIETCSPKCNKTFDFNEGNIEYDYSANSSISFREKRSLNSNKETTEAMTEFHIVKGIQKTENFAPIKDEIALMHDERKTSDHNMQVALSLSLFTAMVLICMIGFTSFHITTRDKIVTVIP